METTLWSGVAAGSSLQSVPEHTSGGGGAGLSEAGKARGDQGPLSNWADSKERPDQQCGS